MGRYSIFRRFHSKVCLHWFPSKRHGWVELDRFWTAGRSTTLQAEQRSFSGDTADVWEVPQESYYEFLTCWNGWRHFQSDSKDFLGTPFSGASSSWHQDMRGSFEAWKLHLPPGALAKVMSWAPNHQQRSGVPSNLLRSFWVKFWGRAQDPMVHHHASLLNKIKRSYFRGIPPHSDTQISYTVWSRLVAFKSYPTWSHSPHNMVDFISPCWVGCPIHQTT